MCYFVFFLDIDIELKPVILVFFFLYRYTDNLLYFIYDGTGNFDIHLSKRAIKLILVM